MSDCGDSLGCFRHCKSEPNCQADDTELIVTTGLHSRADPDEPEIEFKLGGKLFSNGSVSLLHTKNIQIVDSPSNNASFGTFCVQIGQLIKSH